MPTTYTLIASNTLSSSAASVTFSAIPDTFTDLVLNLSVDTDQATVTQNVRLRYNGDTTSNYSETRIFGNNSTATSSRSTNTTITSLNQLANGANATANTFGNGEVYLANYSSTATKVISSFGVSENNTSTDGYVSAIAHQYRGSSGISEIRIYPQSGNFVAGSSFFLYGIKNS